MAPSTEAQICNVALSRIGNSNFIDNLDEATTEGRVCNQLYEPTRDSLLASFPWPFATRMVTLATVADAEHTAWGYTYSLPSDYLAAQSPWSSYRDPTVGQRIPYSVEMNTAGDGRVLLTDHDEAQFTYTAKVTDPGLFPPLFRSALSWALAAELALPIAKRLDLRQSALQMFELTMGRAASKAAGESHETMQDSEFITIRS